VGNGFSGSDSFGPEFLTLGALGGAISGFFGLNWLEINLYCLSFALVIYVCNGVKPACMDC
jgi:hypothetical protein